MDRTYLAGPMSNLPDFNYPAFHKAAASLRANGLHVENPAENPTPECGTWAAYMRMAMAQLLTCDTIALLPGWTASRGARLEHKVAVELGMRVVVLDGAEQPS